MRRASWQVRLALLPLVAAVGAAVGVARSHPGPAGGPIAVRTAGCGMPPPAADAGRVEFAVTDDTDVFATVYLVDADTAANRVYAEIPWLTPGRTLPLATTLGAGRYAIRCVLSNGKVHTTSQFSVTGTTTNAVAGYRPLPDLDLTAPVKAYRAWLGTALPNLLAAGQTLDADVARGDLRAAKTDWLTAHLDYERLGAAYNSFGDFDAAIDGTSAGLPKGMADKNWAGLHAIEYALWHGAAAPEIRPLTQGLVSSVQGLIADFPSEEVDPGDLPLRAHEILENTLEFQITAAADAGSGTSLATAYANTEGTQEVLSVLAPLIDSHAPGLRAKLDAEISILQNDLLATRDGAGAWTPAPAISTVQRQHLDADLDQLLEDLSTVPNLLTPRTKA